MKISIDSHALLNKILYGCILFVFLNPMYIATFPFWDALFTGIQVCVFLAFIAKYFFFEKRKLQLTLFALGYIAVPLLMTVIYSGDFFKVCAFLITVLNAIMLWDFSDRNELILLLRILNLLLEILIYINLITILMFPNGLYLFTNTYGIAFNAAWLFGYRTSHTTYLILGCFTSVLNFFFSQHKFRDMIRVMVMHVVVFFTIVELKSGIGYVEGTIYIACMLFYVVCARFRFPFNIAVLFHALLFFAITVFSATYLFSTVFAFFGKDGTATGRTTIWLFTWQHVLQKPIFGHGIENNTDLLWLQRLAAGATTSHNTFLDILLRGGIVTYIIFLILLIAIGNRLQRCKSNVRLYNLASVAFLTFFLTLQTEGASGSAVLFLLLGVLWRLPDLLQQNELERLYGNEYSNASIYLLRHL